MKRTNKILLLSIGMLVFFISYALDQQISLIFKSDQSKFLSLIFGIITNFGVVLVVFLLIPLILLYKKKRLPYLLLIAFLASFLLAFIAKLIVLRQRPANILVYPLINIINYSFPSMHAAVAFSLLPALVKFLPKQKYFWIVFAFLAAFSRIYFGFHFLSDVVFGALFGYFIGLFVLEYYEKNANK